MIANSMKLIVFAKILQKFTGKHLRRNLFINKVADLRGLQLY